MICRREYLLRGVVQGVGFRPHVAVVAARHRVNGFVGNDDLQVFIEAQGEPDVLEAFIADLLDTLPPLARVIAVSSRELALGTEDDFRIVPSRHLPGVRTLIPPDVATCDDCLADMADPANRRYGYAFTTCTNCGPRLTIIEDLPYDRPATTMRDFGLCPGCAAEYSDPADRRYHAQPISCYDCGPTLWLVDSPGPGVADPEWVRTSSVRPIPEPSASTGGERTDLVRADQAGVIAEARRRLFAGQILAVKGLGGFHLMCDARNASAVERLRERKRRSGKPFAVMVRDTSAALALAELSPDQLGQLANPSRPILIAPMSAGYDLAEAVAPGLRDVGLMLPYAPLHSLLLGGEEPLALVATSGNLSEEPLCFTNADALTRLAHLADAFVLHDRGIHVPVEDSVMLALPGSDALPIRRSRGYAPLPVLLPPADGRGAAPVVLAVGGELKNTFALASDDLAFVSAHVGDMGSLASQQAFEASVAQLLTIHRREPEVVVCDLHPGYATTGWAERYADAHPDVRLVRVQHHYAHALSLLAEYGIGKGPVVVAALDGTGYGSDGTIWGGEILTLGADGASPATWERSWHVPTFSLVGGDRAIKHPWRIAHGLAHSWGLDISGTPADRDAPEAERRLVASQLASGTGVVATSSAGRLFDAASALLGLCLEATYEAHAAMALERAATAWARECCVHGSGEATESAVIGAPGFGQVNPPDLSQVNPPDLGQATGPDRGQVAALSDPTATPSAVFVDLLAHTELSIGERAWRFHQGLAAVIAAQLVAAAEAAATNTVGLTGGVVANRLFTTAIRARLEASGYTVLTHRVVPPTDGGLSLGQAWAGRLLAG